MYIYGLMFDCFLKQICIVLLYMSLYTYSVHKTISDRLRRDVMSPNGTLPGPALGVGVSCASTCVALASTWVRHSKSGDPKMVVFLLVSL